MYRRSLSSDPELDAESQDFLTHEIGTMNTPELGTLPQNSISLKLLRISQWFIWLNLLHSGKISRGKDM